MTKYAWLNQTIRDLLANPIDECVIWPYSKTHGYGTCWDGSRSVRVHRHALGTKLGEVMTKEFDAAHSCRERACFNPHHLRKATPKENQRDRYKDKTSPRHQGALSHNSSGYKGVSFYRSTKRWRASILANEKQRHLGFYATPEEAALAYNERARELWGVDAFQNAIPTEATSS